MEKRGNPRQSLLVKQNGSESKKDIANKVQGRNRKNGNSAGGNFSYNEGPARKPTPQKAGYDKRPRPRGEYSAGTRGHLEELDLGAEYGAAIHTGSKKGNLNHLLNFTYGHDTPSNAQSGYSQRRMGCSGRNRGSYQRSTKVYYNKEQFLQANCQFVVKEQGDYSVNLMNPDSLVSWEAVEQVRVISSEDPCCPICLQHPTAAKMTRCGHIYCWSCILHYLALGEKTWRKCPICYEAVHGDDLKSVSSRKVSEYKIGDVITLTLMKKEKGSIYAVPANCWKKQVGKCHNIQEPAVMTQHCKLLTASTDQVLELLAAERQELHMQMAEAESSEEPFIKGAQDQLKSRELRLQGLQEVEHALPTPASVPERSPVVDPEPTTVPTVKPLPATRKMKQYKSAFSDEEEEGVNDVKVEDETAIATGADHTLTSITSEDSNAVAPERQGRPVSVESDVTESEVEAITSSTDAPGSPTGPDQQAFEMMANFMPVEEAAEHLELPTQSTQKQRYRSGEQAFYFYQAEDGQHIYLHSLNARCLVREYGSLEHCPQTISGKIVEKESVFVTDELRKRLRYLSHLPLTCGFEVAELALAPPIVSKETLKSFQEEIEKRRLTRQRRAREDRKRSKFIEEQERKKLGLCIGTIVRSQFHTQTTVQEGRSDTSSPLLDTPASSPSVGSVEEFPAGMSPGDDGQTAAVSFAQMLKSGAKSATSWPKVRVGAEKSPAFLKSKSQGSDDSDNEDKVPVPEFSSSFGSALEAAFQTISSKKESGEKPGGSGGSGKKKKKQMVLFSTSMARK